MFRLSLLTVIGVTVLVLLFQVTQVPADSRAAEFYRSIVGEMLDAQTVKSDWRWHPGPLPAPGTEAQKGDYVTLSPWSVDWSRSHSEGRRLPEPPPMPRTPKVVKASSRFEPIIVATGYAQTEWHLMRVKGIEDHKLQEAVVGGKRISSEFAKFAAERGEEPELLLHQCYMLPYTVYRFREEVDVPADSTYPLGKRLMEIGPPWVVWEKPFLMSQTWCKASFTETSPSVRHMVPAGSYVLPVVEPGK